MLVSAFTPRRTPLFVFPATRFRSRASLPSLPSATPPPPAGAPPRVAPPPPPGAILPALPRPALGSPPAPGASSFFAWGTGPNTRYAAARVRRRSSALCCTPALRAPPPHRSLESSRRDGMALSLRVLSFSAGRAAVAACSFPAFSDEGAPCSCDASCPPGKAGWWRGSALVAVATGETLTWHGGTGGSERAESRGEER